MDIKFDIDKNDLRYLNMMTKQVAEKLSENLMSGVKNILISVGQLAASEYMIPTSARKGMGKVFGQKTDATKLTWRTGKLARSLTRTGAGNDGGINVKKKGMMSVEGTIYTGVPYARIHEYGGVIPEQMITPKQRRFFWAAYHKNDDEMWKALALGKTVRAKVIPKRPFLNPAMKDKDISMAANRMMNKAIRDAVQELKIRWGKKGK
jgi:phage gpG-like protein